MSVIHVAVFWVATVLFLTLLGVSLRLALVARSLRRDQVDARVERRAARGIARARLWSDRLILGSLVAVGVAILSGGVLLALGDPPADPLHYLYAAVVALVVPAARYAVRGASPQRFGLGIAAASLVACGVLVRLFMTGR